MRIFHAFSLDHDLHDALRKVDARTPGITASKLLVHPFDSPDDRVLDRLPNAEYDMVVQRGYFYIEILEVVIKGETNDD